MEGERGRESGESRREYSLRFFCYIIRKRKMAWLIDKILKAALILFLVWLTIAGYNYWWGNKNSAVILQNSETSNGNQTKSLAMPDRVNLDVPFTSQAPEGNWGSPFDHSCEEASVLMIHYYIDKKVFDNPATTAGELKEMNDFEQAKYGVYWEPLAKAASNWRECEAASYLSVTDLTREIKNGNPLVFWGVLPVSNLTNCSWKTADGKAVKAYKETHVRLVIGFIGPQNNPSKIIINDPLAGRLYWPVGTFLDSWEHFNYSGVVVR